MAKDNTYLLARIFAFNRAINDLNTWEDTEKAQELLRFFRNGYWHEDYPKKEDEEIAFILKNGNLEKELTFTQLCSFSTWFVKHPEKQAGQEYPTTSFHFPLQVKGSKNDILNMFSFLEDLPGNKVIHKNDNSENRIRIARIKAQAKLKMLEILKI